VIIHWSQDIQTLPAFYTAILAIVYTIGMAFAVLIFVRSARQLPVAYDLIYTAMDEAAIVLDMDGLILSANPSAERLFGKQSAELIQRPIAEVIPTGTGFPSKTALAVTFDCVLDSGVVCRCQIIPLVRGGASIGSLLVLRDVTTQRQAEERLRADEQHAKTLLESLPDMMFSADRQGQNDQILSRFIRNTLEEFHRPVTHIKNSAYMLVRHHDPDKRARHLEQIQTQTTQLIGLIDLLDELAQP